MANSKQRGFSVLSGLAAVALIAATVTTALRIGPHYVDFRTIQSIMDSLPAAQVHDMDKGAIREILRKRFRINNIRGFKVQDILTIERSKGSTVVDIDYEVRENLLFNADIVVMFDDRYEYN